MVEVDDGSRVGLLEEKVEAEIEFESEGEEEHGVGDVLAGHTGSCGWW